MNRPKGRKAKTLPVNLKVVGLILSESYQRCKMFAQKLRRHQSKAFLEPSIKGLLEMDWVEYLNKLRKNVGGQTWAMKNGVVVFIDDVFIGGEDELFQRLNAYIYKSPSSDKITNAAKQEYLSYLNRRNLLYVYFELSVAGEYMGTLLFELRSDLLPKTCSWFALLCDPQNHMRRSYKGTTIHRICKSGWFQAGKLFTSRTGFMEDESFCYKHDRRGIISLVNEGKDSNRAQFFVTFKPSSWMDQHYVGFGRLVEGSETLNRIECAKCTYEYPVEDITVENCGLAEAGLGRSLVTKLKMRGITVGEPHIHLETFMDLVFDQFCEVLFNRLDDEVKKKFHGEWIAAMLWDTVLPVLATREPISDRLDVNDRTSGEYLQANYLAGLYGLRDVPDHYISKLLQQAVDAAVERSGINKMAESIINLIINTIASDATLTKVTSAQSVATSVVKHLIADVNLILFGEEVSEAGVISKSLSALLAEGKDVPQTPSEIQKRVKFAENSSRQDSEDVLSERRRSTKEIVVEYIWESLLESLKNMRNI